MQGFFKASLIAVLAIIFVGPLLSGCGKTKEMQQPTPEVAVTRAGSGLAFRPAQECSNRTG